MLYDSNKMLVGVGDAFSDRVNIASVVVVHVHPRVSAVIDFVCDRSLYSINVSFINSTLICLYT
jgi:hypothetical protein